MRKSELFYKEGTIQYKWRLLYNAFCDRWRMHASEESLMMRDQRFCHWSRKDEILEDYQRPVQVIEYS